MRVTLTERRIFLAAFCTALGATPALAAPSTTVPSYQPYYYTQAEQERTPITDNTASAAPQPSVEVFPSAAAPQPPQAQLVIPPQPIPTTVNVTPPAPSAPAAATGNLNTVKNLNDELSPAMKEPAPVPVPTSIYATAQAPTPPPSPEVISTSTDTSAPSVSMAAPMPTPLPQPGSPPALAPVPLPAAATFSAPAPMPTPKTNLNLNAPSTSPVTLDQLPSYRNTPDFDQHRTWTTPKAVDKSADDDDDDQSSRNDKYFLNTPGGVDVGLLFEGYHYQEPDAGGTSVNLNGTKYGLDIAGVTHFDRSWYGAAELEYARGLSDYHGSGETDNHLEQLTDIRLLVGEDLISQASDFGTPLYSGLGYRQLYSNDQGAATVGGTTFAGYRRENQMIYLPLGVKPRIAFDNDSRIEFTLEGDLTLWGLQTSYLGDVGDGDPTIHNKQDAGSGYGLRTGFMWETRNWGFGPYLNYWSINESETKIFASPASTCGGPVCVGAEPNNHTLEYGVQGKYHFDGF